jgi:phospholipid transport system substrate-binding protein
MKRALFPTVAALTLSMLFSISTAFAAVEPAPVFVKRISDTLIARLVSQRAIYKKNPALLNDIVKENIEPYVDFDGFARGVMGQFYRQANDSQRAAFAQTFRQSLIRTYSKGLASYDNESYSIRPFVEGKDPSKAEVNMDFKTDTGTVVPVTYKLIQSGDSWKLRNLTLNGIDIGLTFRNQFATAVQANNNNLDLAIKNFIPSANASGQ